LSHDALVGVKVQVEAGVPQELGGELVEQGTLRSAQDSILYSNRVRGSSSTAWEGYRGQG